MKLRNYKWLELVENVKEMLKNNENVEIKNCLERWSYGRNGTGYELKEKVTDFNRHCNNYVYLEEYPLNDGVKYRLSATYNSNGNSNKFGILELILSDNKISFGREHDFLKNENDKPMNTNEVLEFIEKALNIIKVYNKIDKLINEDNNKRILIGKYLQCSKIEITGGETEEQIQEIVNKGSNLTEVDGRDLFKQLVEKYFNCKDEKLFKILNYSLDYNGKNNFVSYCVQEGLLDNYLIDYSNYGNRYFKLA